VISLKNFGLFLFFVLLEFIPTSCYFFFRAQSDKEEMVMEISHYIANEFDLGQQENEINKN